MLNITPQEQLSIALDVYNRLRPEMQAQASTAVSLPAASTWLPRRAVPQPATRPSLSSVLRKLGPLPPYTVLMGICSDKVPLLLDLAEPSAGGLLVLGDASSGVTQLLRATIGSACQLNHPGEVAFHLVTARPEAFHGLTSLPHCQAVLSPHDRASAVRVVELSALAEQRRSGRQLGTAHLLVIDQLSDLLQYKEYEVEVYLKWLLRHGPANAVWPVVTLDPAELHGVPHQVLDAFQTRILGRLGSLPYGLLPTLEEETNALQPGEFCARFGQDWIRFWTPDV